MPFAGSATGGINGANDVVLSNPSEQNVLTFNNTTKKWENKSSSTAKSESYASFSAALTDSTTNKKVLVLDTDITAPSVSSAIWTADIIGNGSVTVNGYTFWPNPKAARGQINTMFVNPTTGNDTRSGIDAAAPIKTLASAYAKLKAAGASLSDGSWKVCIQAGTHSAQGAKFVNVQTSFELEIYGEKDANGNPTTILDGTNDTLGQAFWFEPGAYVRIRDLVIRNYTDATATSDFTSVENGYGIIVKGGGRANFDNLRISNCSTGISINNQSQGTITNSTITGCNTGVVVLYGSTGTVGTLNNGNVISNCDVGVHLTRNAVAHVDFNTITDCTTAGLQTTMAARAAVLQGTFYRNGVGVKALGASEVVIDTVTDYGVGTANANGTARQFFGVAREARQYSMEPNTNEYNTYRSVDPVTHTGTTSRTAIILLPSNVEYREGHFVDVNRKLRVRIVGSTSGAGTKTLQFYKNDKSALNSQPLANIAIPSTHTGTFIAEAEIVPTSATAVQWITSLNAHQQTNYVTRGTYAINSSHTWIFRLYATLADANASVDVYSFELYSAG